MKQYKNGIMVKHELRPQEVIEFLIPNYSNIPPFQYFD